MKKFALISGALLLVSAPAFAQHVVGPGVDLTFNNCVNEGGITAKNLNCVASQTNKVHGCFKVPITITGFVAVDGSFDLQNETNPGPLNPFWHYESGGCNNSGLQIRHDISVSGGCDSENNPWGDFGADASSFITAYVPGYNGIPNRGRILISIARSAANPTQLDPVKNWYMFHFLLTTNNRAACAGCTEKVAIVWNSATLYNNEGRDAEVLVGPDKTANCDQINGASLSTCAATPTRNSTWGQLKALYR